MESFEHRRYPCVFVTVCDNSGKCVLNSLEFAHVETGHTPEDRVAVIKATAHSNSNSTFIALNLCRSDRL